jgi:hypothetical protein
MRIIEVDGLGGGACDTYQMVKEQALVTLVMGKRNGGIRSDVTDYEGAICRSRLPEEYKRVGNEQVPPSHGC